ncbi:MAG: hypothetical protein H8D47_00680 [Planctomycetes bacterium]|nr:hypothetical protein [Planctomycetota bacterium]
MINKTKNKGFVTILVIVYLAVIAAEILVLTGISNIIAFQTNNAYLNSVEKNLTDSGIAWARYNLTKITNEPDQSTTLDVSVASIKRASLTIIHPDKHTQSNLINISTSCSKGNRTLSHTKKFQIITSKR